MSTVIGALVAIVISIIYLLYELLFGNGPHSIMGGDDGDRRAHNPITQTFTNTQSSDVAQLIDYCARTTDPPTMTTMEHLRRGLPKIFAYRALRVPRRTLHIGQLKLFLSEVQFLTDVLPRIAPGAALKAPVYVVYAGSAPGQHDALLADMFPNIIWILIDPHEHDIFYAGEDPVALKRGTPHKFAADALFYRSADSQKYPNEKVKVAIMGKKEPQIEPKGRVNAVANRVAAPTDIVDRIIASGAEYRFHIIEDYFTNELATAMTKLKTKAPALYISDIRSNTFDIHERDAQRDPRIREALDQFASINQDEASRRMKAQGRDEKLKAPRSGDDDTPTDLDILWNNAMQLVWVNLLGPSACMLKFRPPYFNSGDRMIVDLLSPMPMYQATFGKVREMFDVDTIADYARGVYQYMQYDMINLQTYHGNSSIETRLVSSQGKYNQMAKYDKEYHENALCVHNIYREYAFHERNAEFFDPEIGIDGCVDCDLFIHIIRRYCELAGTAGPRPIKNWIARTLDMNRRTLLDEFHGDLLWPFRDTQDALYDVCDRMLAYNYVSGLLKHKVQ